MSFLGKIGNRIREFFLDKGYTCDACDAELFDYPKHRFCTRCEGEMCHNTGRICPKCGRKTRAEGVCLSCKSNMPRFTKGFSPFVYQDRSAALINRFKNGNPILGRYFGEKIAEYFLKSNECNDGDFLLIPVPLSKESKRERGYNQAEELARAVLRKLTEAGVKAELRCDILEKTKETALQKRMGAKERIKNVEGAYHVRVRTACRGRKILLVDDIMTTGATGNECAAKLLSAGASKVYFLCATSLVELK